MHVVHVVRSDAFAGVERHVAQLAGAQAAMGHVVTVIGGRAVEVLHVAGPHRIVHLPGGSLLSAGTALRRRLRESPADVVHAHMTAAELAAALALLPNGSPLVATRHFAQRRGRNAALNRLLAVVSRRVSAQIAISRYVAAAVEGPSTVVLPGVPGRGVRLAAPQREPVVLVVQRLEPEKATRDALMTFVQSRLSALGWRLEVAGDGSQRGELESLARQHGVGESVRFLGHRTDVPQLMERSAILLAPCPTEGLGLTVLEAMASGLPVVAARSGGHLETVGSVSGAAMHEPGATREAASLLLGLAQDAALRDSYGAVLQQRQRETFTLEAQALATEAVYRRVLSGSAKARSHRGLSR